MPFSIAFFQVFDFSHLPLIMISGGIIIFSCHLQENGIHLKISMYHIYSLSFTLRKDWDKTLPVQFSLAELRIIF